MLYDTHIHTRFSHDSQMTIEEAVRRAEELEIGIIVTEHVDLNYPEGSIFNLDAEAYFQEYAKFRSDRVLLGVEIGLGIDEVEDNRQIVEKHPFDYVIGSIHVVDNFDVYSEQYYRNKTKIEAYNKYFDLMIECIGCCDFFDSLGHIDYICRYAKFKDREIRYADFRERIDQALLLLAQQEKCIEINTRRLDKRFIIDTLAPIYRRFYELGGRWATIGSDAHKPGDIGKNFAAALELAETCNLRPVWFQDRKVHLSN